MQRPLSIAFRDMEPSPAVEARIRTHVEKLEHLYRQIIGCHVVIEAPHHHQHKGKLYRAGINVKVPSGEIVVNSTGPQNHAHEDVYVAIRDAFDALARRLEDHSRRDRGVEKAHAVPTHGKVQKLFPAEGYGFVITSDGDEIYFHENSVANHGFGALKVGTEVRLVIAEKEGEHGAQASTVTPIGKHHPTP